jgi:indolepyruvate ferredoxin oxidoreductase
MAGIGCHYMVTWMDRNTDTFTQMGGEGATWCGQAPFTNEKHVFQNLGDGTYFHSGSLAIRQAIAAKVNITYKILYNDAVAMTGGQPVGGMLSVPDIARQVRSEGVQTIVVMSDDIAKWSRPEIFPNGVEFIHRDELDAVQKRLREVPGTSVLIFDQTCAAELRRRRKRGKVVDPAKRVFINSLVCEGCGDCGVQSNCVAVLPLETEYGRKRTIDQSNCNKDLSCVKGFCPSFVTVHGGTPRKKKQAVDPTADFATLPMPVFQSDLSMPWNILITGIGGTGVVTIGALLGMAAHLQGRGTSVLDQTGLAQKGGAVTTHVRIAKSPAEIHAVRIAAGEADLVLGCDMVVVNDYWALSKIRARRTAVVLNTYEAMPGPFTRLPDLQFPAAGIVQAVRTALAGEEPVQIEGTALATTLLGNAIGTNLFMLGVAWQRGLVPVALDALLRAIELNGAAIEMNKTAFAWGRLAAIDADRVREAAGLRRPTALPIGNAADALQALPPGEWEGHEAGAPAMPTPRSAEETHHLPEHARADADIAPLPLDDARLSRDLDGAIARRVAFLTDYQNAAYAHRYRMLVEKVRATESRRVPGSSALTEAVARYAFKLMAYKDEYEVARLFTSGEFQRRIAQAFDGDYTLRFHLAPPLLSKKDADDHLIKREFGAWVLPAFRLLARFRFLRGGALDIFGRTDERRSERRLIEEYFASVDELLATIDADNAALAVEIASIPEHIRGYGHVKHAQLIQAKQREAELLARWRHPARVPTAA